MVYRVMELVMGEFRELAEDIFNEFMGISDKKTETEEFELNLAVAWFEGKYTQDEAQLSCELQGLDFNRVKQLRLNMITKESEVSING